MDIDKVEDELGGLSCYQVFVVFSCTLYVFGIGMSAQTGVFYYAVPDHRCFLQNFTNSTYFKHDETNITALLIPSGDSCHRYTYNSTACEKVGYFTCLNDSEKEVMSCESGYHYDKTYFERTVVSEWNLVCNKLIWIAILNSIYFMGTLIGSSPVGYMVDWYGRKFSMIVLPLAVIGFGIGGALSPNLTVYCVFRFFEGFVGIPAFGAVFTYINEMTNKDNRTSLGSYILAITGVSNTLLPMIAFFLRDWRDLNLCIALLPIAFLSTVFFIPESPRWLLVKGRTAQAKKVLNRIAKSNGKNLNDDDWELMVENKSKEQAVATSRLHISDLFRRPLVRIVTLIVMFDWFSNICVYYGLILSVGTLSGDPYVNAILNGATEIAAVVLYVLILTRKGPKLAFIIGNGMSGLFCFIAMIAGEFQTSNESAQNVVRWTSIIGKFFASISHYSVYQYTSDIFPTITRGKALAIASTTARIGNIIVPFILFAQSKSKWAVKAILSLLAISSAFFTVWLPNTPRALTTTLQEAEKYYQSNMRWVSRFLMSDRKEDKMSNGVLEVKSDEEKV